MIKLASSFAAFTLAAAPALAQDQFADCRASTVGAAQIGGPFELVDDTGATVTDADVITGPTLVYFGYTFCPDVCPLDAARNALAVDFLAEAGHDGVTPVFITIDPARDTVEIMRDFADVMHEDMIGLTGTDEQVKAAATAYRAFYRAHRSGDEFYLVDHSSFTYLMLPEIGFVEFFRSGASADEVAEATACYLDAL